MRMHELTRRAFAHWTQAQPVVSAFVHALVRDRTERDDVLQDVALAVHDSFASYDDSRPFLPWALAIARRTVADARAGRARRPALLGDAATEALAEALAEVAETERAKLAHLAACIERLQGRAREVCVLRYEHGLKPAEIAERLALRSNTAAKMLQRVREELRLCIEARLRAEEAT